MLETCILAQKYKLHFECEVWFRDFNG
jgi:hypothetical protein